MLVTDGLVEPVAQPPEPTPEIPSVVFESNSARHWISRPVSFGNVTQHWPATSPGE